MTIKYPKCGEIIITPLTYDVEVECTPQTELIKGGGKIKKNTGTANNFLCHRVCSPSDGYSLDEAKYQLAAHPHTYHKCIISRKGLMELAQEDIAVEVAEEFMSRETNQDPSVIERNGFESVIYVLFPDCKTLFIVEMISYVDISHIGNSTEGSEQ